MDSLDNNDSKLIRICKLCGDARCDNFYNIPSHVGKNRSTGIGKGSKMTFGGDNRVPAPNNYHTQSTFDQKGKGVKFSLGR